MINKLITTDTYIKDLYNVLDNYKIDTLKKYFITCNYNYSKYFVNNDNNLSINLTHLSHINIEIKLNLTYTNNKYGLTLLNIKIDGGLINLGNEVLNEAVLIINNIDIDLLSMHTNLLKLNALLLTSINLFLTKLNNISLISVINPMDYINYYYSKFIYCLDNKKESLNNYDALINVLKNNYFNMKLGLGFYRSVYSLYSKINPKLNKSVFIEKYNKEIEKISGELSKEYKKSLYNSISKYRDYNYKDLSKLENYIKNRITISYIFAYKNNTIFSYKFSYDYSLIISINIVINCDKLNYTYNLCLVKELNNIIHISNVSSEEIENQIYNLLDYIINKEVLKKK